MIIKPNLLLLQMYTSLTLIVCLRISKSNIRTDFVRTDQHGIIIMMNKVTSTSDLQMVENYIKNVDYLDPKDIKITIPSSIQILSKNYRYSILDGKY